MQDMRIGLGCVNLGSATSTLSWKEQINLIRRSIDLGVRHFDTADSYANGMSEQILGRALNGRRDQVTISTKGGYVFRDRSIHEQRVRRLAARSLAALPRAPRPDDGPTWAPNTSYGEQDFSTGHLRAAVDASLLRLGTDYIDVFLLHGPPTVLGEVFAELDDLRKSGKVRRFGVGAESIAAAAAWAQTPATSVVQLPFGILDTEAHSQVFAKPRSNEVTYWARGVLGGGLLSQAASNIDSITGHPKAAQIKSLIDIARDADMGVDELAIRWVRSSPDVDLILLGMSSFAHLERNLEIAALPPLPDQIRSKIGSATAEIGAHEVVEE